MLTGEQFAIRRLRELQVSELENELQRVDLTRTMVETIMNATVEACASAYADSDMENGDRFAMLNGLAQSRWHSVITAA